MRTATRVGGAAAVGLIAVAITFLARDFPLRLALISGLAISILFYSTLQAASRLRDVYRRR